MQVKEMPLPMLASPMPKGGILNPSDWVAEEKYDGHRLIVRVTDLLLSTDVPHETTQIADWGRVGDPPKVISAISRDGNPRKLPVHILRVLALLPSGVYDGELTVPGSRSYGVTEKLNESKLVLALFDVLEWMGHSVTAVPCPCLLHCGLTTYNYSYEDRRELLSRAMHSCDVGRYGGALSLKLADTAYLHTQNDITEICRAVWDKGGEGLILKKKGSKYLPGKRSRDWVKIKALASAVLTVYGYEAGKLGPQAKLRLRDDEGNETTVKTRNDAERERLRLNPGAFIGRRLRIEFQERTPDGSYRHPRFDRWEDE